MWDLPVGEDLKPCPWVRQDCIVAKQLLVSLLCSPGATCDISLIVDHEEVERMEWDGTSHCNSLLSGVYIRDVFPHGCSRIGD